MNKTLKQLCIIASLYLIVQTHQALSQVTANSSPDPRLYGWMDKAYIDKLSTDQPELIGYYNYYLDNSYYVVSLKAAKPVTGTDIHTVTLYSEKGSSSEFFNEKKYIQGKFNPLKYNFKRTLDGFTTFVWKEAGVALVFYPMRHFEAQYKDYLKAQKLK